MRSFLARENEFDLESCDFQANRTFHNDHKVEFGNSCCFYEDFRDAFNADSEGSPQDALGAITPAQFKETLKNSLTNIQKYYTFSGFSNHS